MGCVGLAVKDSERERMAEEKSGKNQGRQVKNPRQCPRCDGSGRHKEDGGFKCQFCAGTGEFLIGKDGKKKVLTDRQQRAFDMRCERYDKWKSQQQKGQGRFDSSSDS